MSAAAIGDDQRAHPRRQPVKELPPDRRDQSRPRHDKVASNVARLCRRRIRADFGNGVDRLEPAGFYGNETSKSFFVMFGKNHHFGYDAWNFALLRKRGAGRR